MRIGIIGAGHIGSTLARKLVGLGHRVKLANSRGPETLREVAADTGATAAWAREAAQDAELVVLTIPQKAVASLPPDLFAGLPHGAPIVDTGNYYPFRDGTIAAIVAGQPDSAWTAQQLKRPVVKAFNNIAAICLAELGRPRGAPGRVALPVAGDDAAAKAKVLALVDALGFDALDAGTLAESWRQEPGSRIYGTDLELPAAKEALATTRRDEHARRRDAVMTLFPTLPANPKAADFTRIFREAQQG